MYLILLVSLLISNTYQYVEDPEFLEVRNKHFAECIKQEHVNDHDVFKAWDENHYPDKPKIRCYFKCLSEKLGIMDNDGEIINDVLEKVGPKLIETDAVDKVINECRSVKGANACETGFKLMACIRSASVD